ncbi:MAG: helix-turn-helix domain-containing protein [Tepidisphaeraceae bacterium]
MAKTFDELVARTMTKAARRRAERRAAEMMASLFLPELRKAVGLSQAELAARLGIKQPSLSKLESQEQDIQIGTLRRVVKALGGQLDVVAHFREGSVRLAGFSDGAKLRSLASHQQRRPRAQTV